MSMMGQPFSISDLIDLDLVERLLNHVWKTTSIPARLQNSQKVIRASPQKDPGRPTSIQTVSMSPSDRKEIHKTGCLNQAWLPLTIQNEVIASLVITVGLISAQLLELNSESCVLTITRDITERKRSGDLLRNTHLRLEWAYEATLLGWNRALEMRDVATRRHSDRCIDLTVRLAEAAGISGEELTFVKYGAILRDIGKPAIPDSILNKPAKLDRDEWDSIIHPRAWRPALGEEAARQYLHKTTGTHFNPDPIKLFFSIVGE